MQTTLPVKTFPAYIKYVAMALLAAACNMHLLRGEAPSSLIFTIDGIASGEWYRLITHPLVHVSWYHLSLDALCMTLLYAALPFNRCRKLAAVVLCGAASLSYSLLASPYIGSVGYCGLSGIAHGFMFLTGWAWLFAPSRDTSKTAIMTRIIGLLFCLISLAKSLWEVSSGHILFAGSHSGYLGTPIVHSHLGGVLGGMVSALLLTSWKTKLSNTR